LIPVSLTSLTQRTRSAARNALKASGLLATISESANFAARLDRRIAQDLVKFDLEPFDDLGRQAGGARYSSPDHHLDFGHAEFPESGHIGQLRGAQFEAESHLALPTRARIMPSSFLA
jgi:hypothetical protein